MKVSQGVRSILTAFAVANCIRLSPQVGDAYAIQFNNLDGRTPTRHIGWYRKTSTKFNHLLFCLCVFGAIAIQYIIALELRNAYCDLQNANLDLQVSGDRAVVLSNSQTCGATDYVQLKKAFIFYSRVVGCSSSRH